MLNPFIDLISSIISLLNMALLIWIVLGWLAHFNIINTHQPFVSRVMYFLSRVLDPILRYIRRFIPSIGGLDLSPIVLFLAMNFINSALYNYLYNL